MKIILRQDFETLGKMGEVVEVSNGYACNFLIPKRIGFQATPGNLHTLEEEKKAHVSRQAKELANAKKLAEELEKVSITLPMKVGEDEKLYGSVTNQMVADALKEKGYTIDKRALEIEDSIKALGIYTVNVHLHAGVDGKLKIWVVRE